MADRGSTQELAKPIPAEETWSAPELYDFLIKNARLFGVIMLDREGKVIYWNQGATKIFGYSEAEALGSDGRFLFTPEDIGLKVPEKELAAALRAGHADDERWHLRRGGERIWVTGITTVLRDEGEKVIGFSKVFRESTLRKQTEDEIKAANSRLTQFAYVASHDLKEPLRMVTTFLSLLERKLEGKLDSETQELLRFAREGGKRMGNLIDTLLEYSKIGVARKYLRLSDCSAIVDSAISLLKPIITEADAIVTRTPLPMLEVFPTLFEQVFQNLISNAIKYRQVGKRPCVTIDAVEREKDWLFSVRDNGIGIAEADRERIFGEFERVHAPEDYPGTGLGLAICKRIADRHQGRIWVESQLNEGSTFYFSIAKQITS